MQVPEEVKTLFDGKRIIAMATADSHGMPNVVSMLQYEWVGEDEIIVGDVFMKHTAANVKENGQLSLCAWQGGESYKLKGSATYVTDGPRFDALCGRQAQGQRQVQGRGPYENYRGLQRLPGTGRRNPDG